MTSDREGKNACMLPLKNPKYTTAMKIAQLDLSKTIWTGKKKKKKKASK